MPEECFLPGEKDERLYEVLLHYLESADRGQTPDAREFVSQHPEFARDLQEFLETRDRLEGIAAPLRWVAQAIDAATPAIDDTPGRSDSGSAETCTLRTTRPKSFGEYDICEEVGRGGTCVVYKARHRTYNRLVALKTVRTSRLSDEDAVRRFRNEAETVAALDHPNIVPIYEIAEEDGQLYFSMKLLDGSLKTRLDEFKNNPQAAARLLVTVARAVEYAHRRGVLHRDLKPSNVLLDAEGRPHVADFGLAKWLGNENDLTQTGALLGTPSYMAPEQASPRPRPRPGTEPGPGRGSYDGVTTSADIYGLGSVLYALLTGRPPFSAGSMLLTLEQVRRDQPPQPRSLNPRIDRDLETVCLKCLEKDPSHRYGSAAELADDLERWLNKEPVKARRASVGRRVWLLCRRHPAWAILSGTVAVCVPAVIATLVAAVIGVSRERDRALALEERAESHEKEVTRQLYAADMALAHRNWLHGDVNGLKHLLDNWRPHSASADLRDTAWRLLDPLQRPDPVYPPKLDRVHSRDVYQIAVSPDGRTIASAGRDGVVCVQRPGSPLQILKGHRGEVNWVSFDSRGQWLATASDDGTARVWDPVTGLELLKLPGHFGEVVAAEFTPEADTLITAGKDGKLRQWHMLSGHAGQRIDVSDDRIAALAICPGGQYAATACKDGFVRVFDLGTGALHFKRRLASEAQCIAYSPDGLSLATGDVGGHLWLLSSRDGTPLRMFTCDNGCGIEGVAFSPDGKTLASCGVHGRVRLWDAARSELRCNLDCEDQRFWCATFSRDSSQLFCGASDGCIRSWKLADAYAAHFLPSSPGRVSSSVTFSPDGKELALATVDGEITFRDPQTCKERRDSKRITLQAKGHCRIRYEPAGRVLAASAPDGSLERWSLDGSMPPRVLSRLGPGHRMLSCRSSGTEWAVSDASGRPQRWYVDSGQITPLDFDEPCASAEWSPDGTILAVSLRGRVCLLRDGTEMFKEFRFQRSGWASPTVAFSPDGATVAAVDFCGMIRLWPVRDGKQGQPLESRQSAVHAVAFSPDGKILADGGADGTVKIWDVSSRRELFALTSRCGGAIIEVAFAPDGSCLAALCDNHDGTRDVAIWPASPIAASEPK